MPSAVLLDPAHDATSLHRRFWIYFLTSCAFALLFAIQSADRDQNSAMAGWFIWTPAVALLTGALALTLWRRYRASPNDVSTAPSGATTDTLSDFATWRASRASQIPTAALGEISTALSTKLVASDKDPDSRQQQTPTIERPAAQDRGYWSRILAGLDVDKPKGRSRKR